MAEDRVERRLTTILAADVVGYSRLTGEDIKASRDTGEDAHNFRILHGSVAVSGGALDKTAACHRADSVPQC